MKKSRIEILRDLISFKGKLPDLQNSLNQYSWDVKAPIVKIYKNDLIQVLEKCINNEISLNDLISWANIIECRDDIEFEVDRLQEVVFELANLEINGYLTETKLKQIVHELSTI